MHKHQRVASVDLLSLGSRFDMLSCICSTLAESGNIAVEIAALCSAEGVQVPREFMRRQATRAISRHNQGTLESVVRSKFQDRCFQPLGHLSV